MPKLGEAIDCLSELSGRCLREDFKTFYTVLTNKVQEIQIVEGQCLHQLSGEDHEGIRLWDREMDKITA